MVVRRGQALLVVLLMLGVALTVGVSIASRSATEVSITTTQQEAARALEAAEAGIEKALGGVITSDVEGQPVSSTLPDDKFSVDIGDVTQATERVFDGIEAGDVATVNLEPPTPTPPGAGMPNNAKMLVCWGEGATGTDFDPAAEVILFSRRNSPPQDMWATRWAFDPVVTRRTANGFSAPVAAPTGCPLTSDGGNFNFKTVVTPVKDAPSNPLYLQVKLLYNGATPQPVAVKTTCVGGAGCAGGGWGWFIPFQGRMIVSIGTAGSTTKKLSLTQGFFDPWPIFSSALFAGGGPVLGH